MQDRKPSADTIVCSLCHAEIEAGVESCPSCGGEPLLEERYRFESLLGSGGSGSTYRARDLEGGKAVAVKYVDVGRVENLKDLELVEREIETLKSLDHPGIPRYLDDFTQEHAGGVRIYLIQELLEGEPLSECGPFTEDEVLRIVAEVCEIAEYLHELQPPVIHRDIKPSNLIRRGGGSLALIDFGSVRRSVVEAGEGSTIAGTFGFMAPEQFRGVAEPATDLYGIGATAVALLSGRPPEEMIDPLEPRSWQARVEIRPMFQVLLQSMLEPEIAHRVSEAAEVRRRAERLRSDSHPNPADRAETPSGGDWGWFSEIDELPRATEGERGDLAGELRSAWRRYRVADSLPDFSLQGVEGSDVVLMVVNLGVLGYMIALPLTFAFGLKTAIAAVATLAFVVVPSILGILEFWSSRGVRWRGSLHGAFSQSVDDLEDAVEETKRRGPSEYAGMEGLERLGGLEIGSIVVFEEVALRASRDGDTAVAQRWLQHARRLAALELEGHELLVAALLYRQAPLLYRTPGQQERAIRERLWAERRLREAATTGAGDLESAIERGLESYAAERERLQFQGGANRNAVDRSLWRRRLFDLVVRPFQTAASRGLIRSLVAIAVALFFGVILGQLAGAISSIAFGAEGHFYEFAGMITGGSLALLYALLGLAAEWIGRPGGDWREAWFPEFDAIWPADHPMRGAFVEACEKVWRREDATETIEMLDGHRDEFDPAQLSTFLELKVLYAVRSKPALWMESILEPLRALEAQPMTSARSRTAILDEVVDGLIRCSEDGAASAARRYLARKRKLQSLAVTPDGG